MTLILERPTVRPVQALRPAPPERQPTPPPSVADVAPLPRPITRFWPGLLGLFYLVTGSLFVHAHVLIGDAISRTSTARMVVTGLDPHLGGIGFVWGPLPTFLEIPLVWLEGIWPAFVKDGYVGVVVSAVFAAWGAWHLFSLLRERSLSPRWCRGLTAAVVLNPLVIIFSGNGMSEAIYLCFLLAAIRHLSRYERTGAPSSLAAAGCWLGLDCLVRFETLAAAAGAICFVLVVSTRRHPERPLRARARRAGVDALVVGFPVAFWFGFFIGISWWLTNTALAQYSSLYGQSAQITGLGLSTIASVRVPQVATELVALAPGALLVIPLALYCSWRGRGSVFPVAAAVLGPALFFDIESLSTGGLFNLLRYLILIIPLSVLALSTLAGQPDRLRRVGAAGLAVAVVAASMVGTWMIMGDRALASQEYAYRQAVLGRPATDVSDLQMGGANAVTSWLDAQRTGRGSILIDTFDGFEVLLGTDHPDRFVIPADQNYEQVMGDPYANGARYLVVIPPNGPGALYTLNRFYPGLYQGCLAHTQLALTVAGTGTPSQWRVYRLTGPITPSTLSMSSSCPVHRVVIPG
jgi:hypothetical protein